VRSAPPTSQAIADAVRHLTYGALDREARRLAVALRAAGVGSGDIVGVCGDRSCEFVVGALAVWTAGAAYLPIDAALPLDRVRFMLRDAGATALVGQPLGSHDLPPHVAAGPEDEPETALPRRLPDSVAYVIYTSGSTGTPKAVAVRDRNLGNLVAWHNDAFEVRQADRASLLASVGFDACVWELWPYLSARASLVIPAADVRHDPPRLRDWLLGHRITIAFAPTPLAEQLLRLEWPATAPLRVLLTGGDTLHVRPRPGLPFTLVNNYGPTEATVVATSGVVSPEGAAGRLPSIGRPIANTRVYLLDEEGREVAPGEPGEIWIGGAGVAAGYLNQPELTDSRFVADPLVPGERAYRTGDLASRLPDGALLFAGRMDDQVKVRGCRVELGEVEAVLARHPAVAASAVSMRGAGLGAQLLAYLVPVDNGMLHESSLRAHLAAALPDYMMPAAFVRLDRLPLTSQGKVDRQALPDPTARNLIVDGQRAPGALACAFQPSVSAILTDLLELDAIDPDDNFFLLGGHSLLAAQVVARVRDGLGVDLQLRAVFERPTARQLAALVAARIVEGAGRGAAA
jgi:amino acid adenylation domain-containing protein